MKLQLACIVVMCAAMWGCRNQTEPPAGAAPAPSPQRATEIRQRLLSEDPSLLIGDVVEVLPEAQLAAVADAPTSRFQPGDVVVFLDSAAEPVASGEIVKISGDQLHVRYTSKTRAPQQGDLAVRKPH